MDAPVERRLRNPWWIPPILGGVPPEIGPRQLRLLGVVALALLFENYDISMFQSALKYIRDDFGLPQSELGRLGALVRLGALPAIFVIPFVDRLGRRRVFLAAIVGMSIGTFLTAFAGSELQFLAAQMLSRTFLVTATATAFVIVSEEFPAERRGWGVGILGALGAFGFGLGAILFAFIERLPHGWRALYIVGITPLLFWRRFLREVPETQRFAASGRPPITLGEALRGFWAPLAELLLRHPGRALGVALLGAFAAGGFTSGFQLMGDYLISNRGWRPWQYSTLFIAGGLLGIIGNPLSGRLGDAYGRRLVGAAVLAAFPIFMFLFYHGEGWMIPAAWIPGVFAVSGGTTITRAITTELLPTSARGTATGWLMLLETLGAALALYTITRWTPTGQSVIPAVSALSCLAFGAALVVLFLPETARRELD